MAFSALSQRKALCITILNCLPVSAGVAWSQETAFIRGDANGDGEVTISDPVFIFNFLALGGEQPSCLKAADVNDDGKVDITDMSQLKDHVFHLAKPPCAPYPAPGFDPSQDDLTCLDSGGGLPPFDADAAIKIVFEGIEDRCCPSLTVYLSSSRTISGFRAGFSVDDDVLANGGLNPFEDITGHGGDTEVRVQGQLLVLVVTFQLMHPLPPGEFVPVLRTTPCIEANTPEGEYELHAESAEMIDAQTGLAIHPRVYAEPIRIDEPVLGGDGRGCEDRPDYEPPKGKPRPARGPRACRSCAATPTRMAS